MQPDGSFEFIDFLKVKNNQRIVIDGLWAIQFGSGGPANGPTNTLFFTSGALWRIARPFWLVGIWQLASSGRLAGDKGRCRAGVATEGH
jgi:hypothetical protein